MRHAHAGRFVLVFLLLLASILAVPQSGSALEIEHLAYGGHHQEHVDYLKDRAEAFEQASGIKVSVNVSATGAQDYAAQILLRYAAGSPPTVTDLYPSIAGECMTQGVLEDLQPWFEKDNTVRLQDLVPPAVELWRGPRGEIFAFPPDIGTVAVAYNATIFAEAGMLNPRELKSEWNWNSVLQTASRLTVDKNGDGVIDQWASRTNFRDLLGIVIPVQQAGGHIFDRPIFPAKAAFGSPAMLTALEYAREVYRRQNDADGTADLTTTAVDLWYQSGFVSNTAATLDAEWGVAHQPTGPAGTSAWVGNMGYQMSSGVSNEYKDAVWQWLKFISIDRDSIAARVAATGRIPAYLPYLAGFNYAGVFMHRVPASVNVFIEQLQDTERYRMIPYPVSPAFGAIRTAFNQRSAQFLTGKISAAQFVEEMQRIAETELSRLQ
ncbi:MAG: extracellular solute-binding protein [Limnochordia bacterium]|jgi:ABC-type glycerol-3-phosphate transport system substrate-binding protein